MTRERDDIARLFARICADAARPVMEVYQTEFTAEQKADRSPVTAADQRAEEVILAALAKTMPGVTVLAEESFAAGVRPEVTGDFLLVDPVDGTKEFINKNGEFTLNIALISNREPVAGCVFAPARGRIYLGGGKALSAPLSAGGDVDAAELGEIRTRTPDPARLVAVMSRSHADERTKAFAEQAGVTDTVSAGSSLKFCLLAEARADLYPRFAPTMEWDTAAGHAVLNAAGGQVTTPEGEAFLYGKTQDGYLNGHFIARGRQA